MAKAKQSRQPAPLVITISPSRLNTWLDCPQKYAEQYLQPERPLDTPTLPKFFGSFVHGVLEQCLIQNTKQGELTEDDCVFTMSTMFEQLFGQDSVAKVMEFSGQFSRACEDTMAYGASIGKLYKSPQQTGYFSWKHRQGLEELFRRVADVDADMYTFYEDAHKCVTNFYTWFTSEGNGYTIEPELAIDNLTISLPTLDNQVEVRYNGIMDVFMRKGDDIIVVDFKTNRTAYDKHFTNFSVQLGLYALAVKQRYGVVPKIGYLELKHNKFTKKELSHNDLARYEHFFARLVMDILEFKQDYDTSTEHDFSFYAKYASRFPVSSASTQACPCDFASKCVFMQQ